MSRIDLPRRPAILEVFLSADRRTVAFWAMTEAGEPLTDQEMEGVISALRAGAGTVNLEFDSCTWEVAPLAV
jgi:hypothetical protein